MSSRSQEGAMRSEATVDTDEGAVHEASHLPEQAFDTALSTEAPSSPQEQEAAAGARAERSVCTCLCHALQSRHSPRCADAGNEDKYGIDWHWDKENKSPYADVSETGNEVYFHADFSNGTSAIRGTKGFTKGQHYWEIKMTSPVYGTDMMVGFGTAAAELGSYSDLFVSFLGLCSETWGLSYLGQVWHNGASKPLCQRFGQDAIIGVHLDMWLGKATFSVDGCLVGTAFTEGLRGKKLYPMVCSTAARTSMRITRTCSAVSSLQFMCCQALRRIVPGDRKLTDVLPLPPGMRHQLDNNLDWLVRRSTAPPVSGSSDGAAAAWAARDRSAGLLQPSAAAVAAARKRCMRAGTALRRPQPWVRSSGSHGKRLRGESDDPTGSDRESNEDDEEEDDDNEEEDDRRGDAAVG